MGLFLFLCPLGQVSNASLSAEHNPVLEHSLHQLLREIHQNNGSHGLPQPVTTTPSGPKRRKLAGPLGYTREQMQEKSPSTLVFSLVCM
jgi:hypothetical protein